MKPRRIRDSCGIDALAQFASHREMEGDARGDDEDAQGEGIPAPATAARGLAILARIIADAHRSATSRLPEEGRATLVELPVEEGENDQREAGLEMPGYSRADLSTSVPPRRRGRPPETIRCIVAPAPAAQGASGVGLSPSATPSAIAPNSPRTLLRRAS